MAAKPISQEISDEVLRLWRIGWPAHHIADDKKIGLSTVKKICKGVQRDAAPLVASIVKNTQELKQHDSLMIAAIEDEVATITGRLEYLNRQAMRNVQEAMDARCIDQGDFRARADTILKSKETLVGKTPETAIQINNQTGSPSNSASMEEIREELKNRDW